MYRSYPKQKFTGERLVPGNKFLLPARIENLARFKFFTEHAHGPLILDLGCGTGEGSLYLSEHSGWKVIAIDNSFSGLTVASSKKDFSRVFFTQMDAGHLAFPRNSFDSVISVEVIEHIFEPLSYLQEASRVLKDNGLFMLTTPNKLVSSPQPGMIWPEHVREYESEELKDLLLSVFPSVDLWGQSIPVYERNPFRRFIRKLAPFLKPRIPRWLRVRGLHILQTAIKSNLQFEDIMFTQEKIVNLPTLVALCKK